MLTPTTYDMKELFFVFWSLNKDMRLGTRTTKAFTDISIDIGLASRIWHLRMRDKFNRQIVFTYISVMNQLAYLDVVCE